MTLDQFKRKVKAAKAEAVRCLRKHGIDDRFTVKVHAHSMFAENALACYRSMSQFRSGPIFWLNPNFPSLIEKEGLSDQFQGILLDTILHEYGHAMFEYIKWNTPKGLKESVDALNTGSDFEEDFAETMAQTLSGRWSNPAYSKIARDFGEDLAKKLA